MDLLAPWKTKNDSNSEHRLKIPKILLDTNEVINSGLLYRLHHHPHQRVHIILLPALTGDLLEKWKNGKECWEKWDGEQCNRRGVEDTGVREEQAQMSALSLCILPRWTEALWCHQASPLKWKQTNYKVSTADYGYSKGFWDEKGHGIQEPLLEDSPLTFNPLSQANWAKGDM